MAVEDRAKELNSLAEKIQGSFTNFRARLISRVPKFYVLSSLLFKSFIAG